MMELEAENEKLSLRLSTCTCSEKEKKRSSSAVKGETMTRFTCNLPKELLVEILSQLPPKSLMRLKCVSKSWYVFIKNLIKDPTFVAKHLQNSISSTYMLFGTSSFYFCCKDCDTPKFSVVAFSLFDLLSDDNADDQIHFSTEKLSPLLIPMTNYISDRMEQYHCDGIFCLVDFWDDAHTITLCSPAIKEFRLLPKPSHVFRNRGVGFGYDSRASDYKVVIFGYDLLKRFRAEVYSLATHSWREISHGFDVDCIPYSGTYVYLNGIFYWFIWHPEPVIHCFNMCNEMFQTISMPGDGGYESVCTRLAVWNESVAVIYSFWDDNKGYAMFFEIWVMDNDYDSNKGSCSWNKVFTVGPLVGVNDVLALRNNDELLIKNANGVLCSYNIASQKLREIDIHEMDADVQFWSSSYVKSLVSVQRKE